MLKLHLKTNLHMAWDRKVQMSEYKRASTTKFVYVYTNHENITFHYIRNLHLGAIVLFIINISVTAKNGSFFINMAIQMSYSKFNNVTVWSKG